MKQGEYSSYFVAKVDYVLNVGSSVMACGSSILQVMCTIMQEVLFVTELYPPPSPQNSLTTYWKTQDTILTWECDIAHSMIQLQIALVDGKAPVWSRDNTTG